MTWGCKLAPINYQVSTASLSARPCGGAAESVGLLDLRRPLVELAAQTSSDYSPRDSVWKRYFCNSEASAAAGGIGTAGRLSSMSTSGCETRNQTQVEQEPRLGSHSDTKSTRSMTDSTMHALQERVSSCSALRGDARHDPVNMASALPPQNVTVSPPPSANDVAGDLMDNGQPSTPPRMPQLSSAYQVSESDRQAIGLGKTEALAITTSIANSGLTDQIAPLVLPSEQPGQPHQLVGSMNIHSSTARLVGQSLSRTQSNPIGVLDPVAEQPQKKSVAACAESITAQDLQLIRGQGRPHAAVREVAETTLMLLGFRDATWSAAQMYFDRAGAFLDKVRNFDASKSVSRLQYQKLCRSLASSQAFSDEAYMESICPAAVGLVSWCRAVSDVLALRYGECSEQLRGPHSGRKASVRSPRGSVDDCVSRVGSTATTADAPSTLGSPVPSRGQLRTGSFDVDDDLDGSLPSRPSLGDLEVIPDVYNMSVNELRRVRDFTIRKPNVGEVMFPGEIDLVKERRVLEELTSIVRLDPGEVLVYPDADTKPREGEGLNRQALITLFQCRPPSGSLTDAESKAKYRDRIARMTEVKGATFVDYDCDRGIWRFSINHF